MQGAACRSAREEVGHGSIRIWSSGGGDGAAVPPWRYLGCFVEIADVATGPIGVDPFLNQKRGPANIRARRHKVEPPSGARTPT